MFLMRRSQNILDDILYFCECVKVVQMIWFINIFRARGQSNTHRPVHQSLSANVVWYKGGQKLSYRNVNTYIVN